MMNLFSPTELPSTTKTYEEVIQVYKRTQTIYDINKRCTVLWNLSKASCGIGTNECLRLCKKMLLELASQLKDNALKSHCNVIIQRLGLRLRHSDITLSFASFANPSFIDDSLTLDIAKMMRFKNLECIYYYFNNDIHACLSILMLSKLYSIILFLVKRDGIKIEEKGDILLMGIICKQLNDTITSNVYLNMLKINSDLEVVQELQQPMKFTLFSRKLYLKFINEHFSIPKSMYSQL